MTETSLYGRSRELRLLGELLERGRTEGGALLLAGGPGTGKSVLLARAAREARSAGYRLLSSADLPAAPARGNPMLVAVAALTMLERAAAEGPVAVIADD